MQTSAILERFLEPFLVIGIVWILAVLISRAASDFRLPFVSASAFPELVGLKIEEQRRILYQASKMAFRHLKAFLPGIVLAAFIAAGSTLGFVLPKFTSLPDKIWLHSLFAAVFAFFGFFAASKLMRHILRPFLHKIIQQL